MPVFGYFPTITNTATHVESIGNACPDRGSIPRNSTVNTEKQCVIKSSARFCTQKHQFFGAFAFFVENENKTLY